MILLAVISTVKPQPRLWMISEFFFTNCNDLNRVWLMIFQTVKHGQLTHSVTGTTPISSYNQCVKAESNHHTWERRFPAVYRWAERVHAAAVYADHSRRPAPWFLPGWSALSTTSSSSSSLWPKIQRLRSHRYETSLLQSSSFQVLLSTQLTSSKLLGHRVIRPTQPPTLNGIRNEYGTSSPTVEYRVM